MTSGSPSDLIAVNHSEIKGFVQQNFGTVTFVYNFPQGAASSQTREAASAGVFIQACPYRGLFAFQPEDARFFFGREAAVDLVKRLVVRGRVTAVTGASGCGKSSLVFAGVVPALVASDSWVLTTFRPGADPFYSLAGALVPILSGSQIGDSTSAGGQTEAIAKLAVELSSQPARLLEKLHEVNQRNAGKQVLIIADQFEEIYSLCQKPDLRKQFLDQLCHVATLAETGYLHLLLTIRADFLGALIGHRELAGALQNQIDILAAMTRSELTAAVVKPAELLGVRYEAHLVDRILDDVGDDDSSLPLLEFALTQLWEKQSADHVLTHAAYEEIGRVSGAIRQHAEAAYARLDQEERRLTRRLFRRLVSVIAGSDGDEERTTRRQVELQSLDEATQALARGELANRRLVAVSHVADQRDMVEIVHETLLSNWPELARWIREDRDTILRLQQLSVAAAAYDRAGRNPDLLYRGKQLSDYASWAAVNAGELTQSERSFLDDSQRYQRQRTLIQYGGYALTALVVLLAVAGFVQLQRSMEPQVPIPMPPEDFNVAVANFAVEGRDAVNDAGLVDSLDRDAKAVAGEFADALQAHEGEFDGISGQKMKVNVLTPDRFQLGGSDLQSIQQTAKNLNANILVYGTLRADTGRRWSIVPQFYIAGRTVQDWATEIMQEQALSTPESFIPGLASGRSEAVAKLVPSLDVLFALYQGLDLYDQGTAASAKQAAPVFCDSYKQLEGRGIVKGIDLLALFCGHAYDELLQLGGVTPDERTTNTQNAIRAYKDAIRLNPDGLRAQISLAALLISAYKPTRVECTDGDINQITEAKTILEGIEYPISRATTIRGATLRGYWLNRGHVLFWLGLCPDPRHLEQYWPAARDFYQKAITVTASAQEERPDILDYDVAEAHLQIASMDEMAAWFNSDRAPDKYIFGATSNTLYADSALEFDEGLSLLLAHQSEPRSARLAQRMSVDGMFVFCKTGKVDLARRYLPSLTSLPNGMSEEQVLANLDAFDPGLRKECGYGQ